MGNESLVLNIFEGKNIYFAW